MTIDPIVLQWGLGLLGLAITAAVTYMIKSLNQQTTAMNEQSKALAVLVARVNPAIDNVAMVQAHENSIREMQADFARIWGIYDAWKGPASPPHV